MKKRIKKKIAEKVTFFPHPAMDWKEGITPRLTAKRAKHVDFLLRSPFVRREITWNVTPLFSGKSRFRSGRHYRFSSDGDYFTIIREETLLRCAEYRRIEKMEEERALNWTPAYLMPDGSVVKVYIDKYTKAPLPCRLASGDTGDTIEWEGRLTSEVIETIASLGGVEIP